MSYVFDSQEMKQEASRLVAARNNVGNNSGCKRMLDKLSSSNNAMLRLLLEADNLIMSLQQQIAKPVSNALHDELVPRGFK